MIYMMTPKNLMFEKFGKSNLNPVVLILNSEIESSLVLTLNNTTQVHCQLLFPDFWHNNQPSRQLIEQVKCHTPTWYNADRIKILLVRNSGPSLSWSGPLKNCRFRIPDQRTGQDQLHIGGPGIYKFPMKSPIEMIL